MAKKGERMAKLMMPEDPVEEQVNLSCEPTKPLDLATNPLLPAAKPSTILVEVPLCHEMPTVDFCLHIDTRLTPDQSNALRRVAEALDKQQARLASGKRVVHPTDAVKFILEQCAAAASEEAA